MKRWNHPSPLMGEGRVGVALLAVLLTGSVQFLSAAEAGRPLIQIAVEVVEVDQQKTSQLGIEWFNQMRVTEESVPAVFEVGAFTRSRIFADLQVMFEEGAADLLANPKLVTRDGTSATFHAGGELPYAVASGLDAVNVEFKPYGIKLNIQPRLLENRQIAMKLEAEVSAIDTQNGVVINEGILPGIRTRRVTSELTLKPGTTLTLAGLIQQDKQWKRRGVPVLMHIPLLKYLFSRKDEVTRRTSIVVFVTPLILEDGASHVASL